MGGDFLKGFQRMAPTISSDSARTKGGARARAPIGAVEKCRGLMYDVADRAALTKKQEGRPTSQSIAAERRPKARRRRRTAGSGGRLRHDRTSLDACGARRYRRHPALW